MRTSNQVSLVLLACWAALPYAIEAEVSAAALGHAGQLQRAVAGHAEDLFPPGAGLQAAAPVLALEIHRPGEDVERLLVPGTEDARVEMEPAVFQDAKHDALVLLWLSWAEGEGYHQHFATLDSDGWSEVVTLGVQGTPSRLAAPPRIAESHDQLDLELGEGEELSAERRVIHLLWQRGGEAPATLYSPVTFIEGKYVGWHKVYALSDMFFGDSASEGSGTEPGEVVALTDTLARTSDLRVAGDGRSVIVTLANPSHHRLGTVEISPLPLELGALGEQVRQHLLSMVDLFNPGDPSALTDEMRAAIIIMGQRYNLHEAYGSYVANQVADWIDADAELYGWGGLQQLGDDAKALTIEVSSEVYASSRVDPADPSSEIVEINVAGLFENPEQPDPAQVLDVRVRADRPAPAIGEGPTAVFTSRSGADLLVAWEDTEAGVIRWVESRHRVDDGAWSEPFSLSLGDDLSVEQAHRLLAARIH